ncbi:MAG TPA: efflux RND transporter periplasmic adaptor subunit [Caldithrix abyssi]|uniref:Efflux RND transporter periplasmic adaptor subunit n=1 Tax=Caldithrix abyssi TaxID=187145 RepID=A0A7V1PTM3_CALAY|nr:efflux RND transporter periplasmic adaptor subunit [Caldithrix abyssi]
MIQRGLTLFLIISTLLLNACNSSQQADKNRAGKNDSSQVSKKEGKKQDKDFEMIPVETMIIGNGDIADYILLSSNLETEIQADVYSRSQGVVDSIKTEEGRYVQKGQVMLKLEADEYVIAEKKARVEFEKQLSIFKRNEAMHAKALLSNEEFEQAKYSLETARLNWEDARLQLDYMSIRSPISGWVGDRLVKIGQRIQPTDKLFSVVNISQVIAVVNVPEKNVDDLKTGQRAILTSDNIPGVKFEGFVKRISPVVDPASGTVKVTVGVKNRSRKLKPGMFVNVNLIIAVHQNTVLVPKLAIVYENEYMNVFVVKDSLAHKIRLTPGFEDSEKIESLKDLQAGDEVIVVGQAGLKDKTRVRVVARRENPYIKTAR